MPIPVILDTDIGSDIDDTWALGLLLRCPELDVRLVVSATGNTVFRARLMAKMLDRLGRSDIPVAVGPSSSDQPANQGAWLGDYQLEDYPGVVHRDGIQALVDVIMTSAEPVTIIAIAPMTNLAAALAREPRIAQRARVAAMWGSLMCGLHAAPGAVRECNVVSDLPASRAMLAAAWPIVITPLDSCGTVFLREARYRAIETSTDPLCRLILANYDAWWAGHPVGRSTVLFDCVAVHLAHSEALLRVEELPIAIDAEGYTRVDPAGRRIRVATGWKDETAFHDLLVARFTAASVQ